MFVRSGVLFAESGSPVTQSPSPNFDQRPVGAVVDALVIHHISLPPGRFGGDHILQLFSNRLDCRAHPDFAPLQDLRVSAHVLIRRDGEVIQLVNLDARAWHAGVSSLAGRADCNDFSIGIELEGDGDAPFEDAQYASLIAGVRAIQTAYPAITPQRMVGHSDIAPGRKTDPGPQFDWVRFLTAVTPSANG